MGIKKRKSIYALLCLGALGTVLLLSSCQSNIIPPEVRRAPFVEDSKATGEQPENETSTTVVQVYYLDTANQRVVAEEYPLQIFRNDETIIRLFHFLRKQPTGEGLVQAIDPGTALLDVEFKNDIIHVDVSPSFYQSPDLVAARVALVNTLTSLEGIDYVQITVQGQELTFGGEEGELPVGTVEKYVEDLDQVRALDRERLLDEGKIIEGELYFRDIRGEYLLPEVRTIYLDDRPLSILLTEALTLGPKETRGLYPSLPGDIQVLDALQEADTVTLYMSRSFVQTEMMVGHPEQSNLSIRVASLVLTVTSLTDVASVKFYYEDDKGGFTDDPVVGIRFDKAFHKADFSGQIGRRIVVYFPDVHETNLVPEYRAVERDNRAIEQAVLRELLQGPMEGNKIAIPSQLKLLKPTVRLESSNSVAVIDLPAGYDGAELSSTGQRMLIYSIVNSLTDNTNLPTVTQVRFTVGGETVDTFGSVDISQPFARNPSLIQS